MKQTDLELIAPNWPASEKVRAFTSCRTGGLSIEPFEHLNLAKHVGDDAHTVESNRQLLQQFSEHPADPHWLTQTHSTEVVEYNPAEFECEADAVFTTQTNQACVVMTADCLPVLLCSKNGDFVAAVHAGWRGLADGITIKAAKKYAKPSELMAWIGPAISQEYFEVGQDVYDEFCKPAPYLSAHFKAVGENKYYADLPAIAADQLQGLGVETYQSELCSYAESERFYSYRRDGRTGRMATMIWLEA
ncbi:MAG: peptidoglycan editing factor PgeF [Gammaproteobacteria bacterium]|nr:peptidoglycan editing factor PgeF [Gammaproteobacteria bacterium]